jgi:type II secretory pathway predicted ATPase ExeA
MYEKEFGLWRRPFPPTPDRACYYPATSHENALADLLRAIGEDEALALLTGAPGTGKTLLTHCLLQRLPQVTSALLTHSHFADRDSLLQAILFDFSLPFEGGEQILRLRLTDFLLKNCTDGRRAVLVIDEAHHLRPDLLEELRLLSNLQAGAATAFQILLVAQDSLLDLLTRPELTVFNQRLAVRLRLEPLSFEEAVDYVVHHVRIAGGRPEALFDESALEILARGSRGIPRLLNQSAHQALMLTHQADMSRVDAEAALEALSCLGLDPGADTTSLTEVTGLEEDGVNEEGAEIARTVPLPGNGSIVREGRDQAIDVGGAVRLFESPRRPA